MTTADDYYDTAYELHYTKGDFHKAFDYYLKST